MWRYVVMCGASVLGASVATVPPVLQRDSEWCRCAMSGMTWGAQNGLDETWAPRFTWVIQHVSRLAIFGYTIWLHGGIWISYDIFGIWKTQQYVWPVGQWHFPDCWAQHQIQMELQRQCEAMHHILRPLLCQNRSDSRHPQRLDWHGQLTADSWRCTFWCTERRCCGSPSGSPVEAASMSECEWFESLARLNHVLSEGEVKPRQIKIPKDIQYYPIHEDPLLSLDSIKIHQDSSVFHSFHQAPCRLKQRRVRRRSQAAQTKATCGWINNEALAIKHGKQKSIQIPHFFMGKTSMNG